MENLEETVSTLRFGIRAKRIKNNAIANKSMTLQELHMKMQALRGQIEMLSNENRSLKQELATRDEITGKQGNSVESIRYLKQSLREKDSMLAAEKLKTTSLTHALEETKDKLALTKKSWQDMKQYGEELLVQLSQAEEQQLALQTSIVYEKANAQATSSDRGADDSSDLSSGQELQALRATVANEMELLENWRSELYAWKVEIEEEQQTANDDYARRKAEFEQEKGEWEQRLQERERALGDKAHNIETKMNECSISARKLEKEQKLFKIKEKQFKKDQANINVLMETHANKMKQFESEKKDHLEEVEEKKDITRSLTLIINPCAKSWTKNGISRLPMKSGETISWNGAARLPKNTRKRPSTTMQKKKPYEP